MDEDSEYGKIVSIHACAQKSFDDGKFDMAHKQWESSLKLTTIGNDVQMYKVGAQMVHCNLDGMLWVLCPSHLLPFSLQLYRITAPA